jgi:hypothetical protein
LLASPDGISDDWLVVAQTFEEDEKTGLRAQINWLWGKANTTERTGKPAQIINFAFRNQPLDTGLASGLTLHGELVYFPGAFPLRAVFKTLQILPSPFLPTGFPDFSTFLDGYAAALGLNPWLEIFPGVLEKVVVEKQETGWLVYDSNRAILPLSARFSSSWELFALSGGHPITIFGLWDGFSLLPMTAWDEKRYIQL